MNKIMIQMSLQLFAKNIGKIVQVLKKPQAQAKH